MLELSGSHGSRCDGVSRRQFLRIGAWTACGLTLPDVLRLRAQARPAGPAVKPKSAIVICLQGGPSHIDLYDMKPNAPIEFRGEYDPMHTNVPGIDICDQMPPQASIADKLAIVRGVRFIENNHDLSEVYTGLPRLAARPAFGSIVSRFYPHHTEMPRYVALRKHHYEDPRYVGSAHRPFWPRGFGVENLELAQDLTLDRLEDRKGLRRALDKVRRNVDAVGDLGGHDAFTEQALNIISSTKVRDAFDISLESEATRRLYGDPRATFYYGNYPERWDSHSFLLARRLAEAGVPIVTLSMGSWDHHGGAIAIFPGVRRLLPLLDRSIYALVTDIYQRSLQDEIAVMVWGEFGRTPRINRNAGRDHWPQAGFVLFSGGGYQTGQIIGATDERAEQPRDTNINVQNIVGTLYHTLGIDPSRELINHAGRPVPLRDDREPVRKLL